MDKQCNRVGEGYPSLCAVWKDPDFDAKQRAFYYVRVLENPVCRYSTLICQKTYDLNPLDPDHCSSNLATLPAQQQAEAAKCCSNETTTPYVQPVTQERAWTSPIWYSPSRL